MYIREDRLGKPSRAPKYVGPYKVLQKDWDTNTFHLDLGKREDAVSLSRLKAAVDPEEAS